MANPNHITFIKSGDCIQRRWRIARNRCIHMTNIHSIFHHFASYCFLVTWVDSGGEMIESINWCCKMSMTWVVSITRILMNMVKFDCLLMSQISTGCYPSVEPNRIVTICKCLNIMTLRVIKIDQKVMIYLFFYSVHYLITKRKLKQWWSSIPPISTKRTITSHLKLLNTKRQQHMRLEIQVLVWNRQTDVVVCGCLTPLSISFTFCRGNQFYWLIKPG